MSVVTLDFLTQWDYELHMEKIERLAGLNPKTEQVAAHSLEMFRLLRAFAVLDWTLQHPNDMSEKQSIVKYEKLMERCWKLMSEMQAELEKEPSLIEVVNG